MRAPSWVAASLAAAITLLLSVGVTAVATRHTEVHAAPAAAPATTTRPAPTPTPTRDPGAPPDASGVVTDAASLVIHASPGGPVKVALPNPTAKGAPLVLLIVGKQPGWYQVSLPIRPNGSTGWVPAEAVSVRDIPYQITVKQSTHTATLWHDGTLVRQFPTAVGAPGTESPDGLFFVDVIIDNRGGNTAYGPWVLGLSGFSNVYTTFEGGDAEVAFHGTNNDASVGRSASHGCFRLHNTEVTSLAHTVTLGTPVYVSP